MRYWLTLVLLFTVSFTYGEVASDFGTVGLVDMPSARMRHDSAFTVALAKQPSADSYSFNYQAFPWLEASFRYIIQDPSKSFGDTQGIRDRSYGVKLRLRDEGRYSPSLAVGLQDAIGTGEYGAEYLVASKQVSEVLDVTLGVGWGRLATRNLINNPLADISDRFDTRVGNSSGGGKPTFGEFFAGRSVGLFGGFEYRVPDRNLSFLLEYNSDASPKESKLGFIDVRSPLSYGAVWQLTEGLELGVSWQHGSEVGVRIAATTFSNAKSTHRRNVIPNYRFGVLEGSPDALAAKKWYDKLAIEVENNGLKLRAADLSSNGSIATIEVENTGYMLAIEAISVAAKMAVPFFPKTVKTIRLTLYERGLYPRSVEFPLELIDSSGFAGSVEQLHRQLKILPGYSVQGADYRDNSDLRKVVFSAGLGNSLSLFDPKVPLLYQVYLNLKASVSLFDATLLRVSKRVDLDNNYGEATRISDSVLPHVRSDSNQYLRRGKNGIDQLYVNQYGKLSPSIYYRAFAGILERMYGGVGGEVLYQPYRSRFAYGFSAIAVKQRTFDQRFDFQSYETVTSHASVYWATPFYDYDVAIHAGRYLAEDIGATFELKRTFSNGWQMGLFATLTDVPFSDFGEGSFDKGFTIRIPLESMSTNRSRSRISTDIRPITRDGGARLEAYSSSLWDSLRSTDYDRVYDNLPELLQ